MIVIDNVTDVILRVLRDCPSLNVQAMDSETLHDLLGQLNEKVMDELERQYASLFPTYGFDMSVAFHNLRSAIRRLGTSTKFSLNYMGGLFTATVDANGTNFVGDMPFHGAGIHTDPAMAIDKACREALAAMANAK